MAKLKYRVATCNVFWCENEIDTRFFEDIESQNSYFDLLTSGRFSPLVNFNIGDNIETTIVFTDKTEDSIEDILRRNYCVIQKLEVNEDEEEQIVERRYFFIRDIRQDSGRQVIIDLSLDDIQTNYFRVKNSVAQCFINRACLERFKKVNDTYVFNNDKDSPLFNNEPIVAQELIMDKREEIKFGGKITGADWIKENVAYWQYFYISKSNNSHKYIVDKYGNESFQSDPKAKFKSAYYVDSNQQKSFDSEFDILCVPVYKSNKKIICTYYVGDTLKRVPIEDDIKWFKASNDDSSYIFSAKASVIPPTIACVSTLENGNLILTSTIREPSLENDNYADYGEVNMFGYGGSGNHGFFVLKGAINQSYSDRLYGYNLPTFNLTDLRGRRNIEYEPKLLTNGNCKLMLKDTFGNSYSYDKLKISYRGEYLIYNYNEGISSDITRYYLRLLPERKYPYNNPYYNELISENLTGLVGSADTSLILCNSQYQEMLANNKNFYVQNYLRLFTSQIGSTFAPHTKGGLIGSQIGGVVDSLQFALGVDNLQNAPEIVRNANGNVLFNQGFVNIGYYIEEYSPNPQDKQKIADYLFKFGYNYGRIGRLADFDNIRYYFNYIEAQIDCINYPISNKEKDRLKYKLLNGVRFWNSDNIQYTYENYERSLDNE